MPAEGCTGMMKYLINTVALFRFFELALKLNGDTINPVADVSSEI